MRLVAALRLLATRPVEIIRDASLHLLGDWDPATATVRLATGLSHPLEQLVLLHELLHAADDLSAGNPARERIAHADISRLAPTLLLLLVRAGLWRELSPEQAQEALRALDHVPDERCDHQP